MLKLNYYIRRKPGMPVDEFRDYWRERHGELWVKHAEALGVRRYTQVPDLVDDPVAQNYRTGYAVVGEAYDGLAVTCWSEIAALEKALATSAGKAAWREILEDEKAFIDLPRSMLAFGTDHPVINPRGKLVASEDSDLIRGAYFPESLPGIGLAELQRHWIAVHGGLTHDLSEYSPNIRYFQVHRVDHPITDDMRAARGMPDNPRYFGHAEIWSNLAEQEKAAKNPRRQELFPLFVADIEAFCQMDRGYFVLGKEYPLVDKPIYTLPLPQPAYEAGANALKQAQQ